MAQKVFNQIPMVYQLIVKNSGDSVDVEDRRGHCRNITPDEFPPPSRIICYSTRMRPPWTFETR
jgi:hypothetical protein